MEHEEYCARAARLLYKGLHPRLHPQQDREYSELVRTWLADHRLRQTLEGVATGLELVVVDVSEQGLVLAPRTPESRFAMSLTDYRQSLAGDTQRLSRGALALVQIGIAATFFPTADRLDDLEGYEGESIRLQDIREVVIALCQRLAQAHDPNLGERDSDAVRPDAILHPGADAPLNEHDVGDHEHHHGKRRHHFHRREEGELRRRIQVEPICHFKPAAW